MQTHLTHAELRRFKQLKLETKTQSKSIIDSLNRIIQKQERIKSLALAYERDYLNLNTQMNSIATKKDMETIMKKDLHDASPLAFQFLGNMDLLKKPLVAIIGSRHPTFYGRELTYRFAKALSSFGCTIISGGAIGIDSIANSVALSQGGGSCAIIGSGVKNLYPPSNQFLFQQLQFAQDGLILSEFLENEPAQKWNFPKRNHTIALIADYVLVVEATLTSGSIITAKAAVDYGTDVGAIPGALDCVNSEGTNSIIKQGLAACVQTPSDVLEKVMSTFSMRKT